MNVTQAAASTAMFQPGTVQREARLQSKVKGSSSDLKITKAAKDFESLLLGNWLQHAEDTFAQAPGVEDGDSDDSTVQMQQGLAIQPLAKALTDSGGIGIASMIAAQLRRTQQPAPADLQHRLDIMKVPVRPEFNSP